jgi:hypothetical protein
MTHRTRKKGFDYWTFRWEAVCDSLNIRIFGKYVGQYDFNFSFLYQHKEMTVEISTIMANYLQTICLFPWLCIASWCSLFDNGRKWPVISISVYAGWSGLFDDVCHLHMVLNSEWRGKGMEGNMRSLHGFDVMWCRCNLISTVLSACAEFCGRNERQHLVT